jgi:hypothetical protein
MIAILWVTVLLFLCLPRTDRLVRAATKNRPSPVWERTADASAGDGARYGMTTMDWVTKAAANRAA